jgi:hypothetical protein
MISLLWSLESANRRKNFKKNYEKIEKILNFFNLLNILENICEDLPGPAKGDKIDPQAPLASNVESSFLCRQFMLKTGLR